MHGCHHGYPAAFCVPPARHAHRKRGMDVNNIQLGAHQLVPELHIQIRRRNHIILLAQRQRPAANHTVRTAILKIPVHHCGKNRHIGILGQILRIIVHRHDYAVDHGKIGVYEYADLQPPSGSAGGLLHFRSLGHMECQHRGGDRPNAAGHRGNGGHPVFGGGKIHVPGEFPGFGIPIGADVDDHLTRGKAILAYKAGLSGCGNQNVRPPGCPGEILGPAVADCHRGVLGHQQHCRRPAHIQAAPDHNGALPGYGDFIILEQLHAGPGGTRGKSPARPRKHRGLGGRRNAVNIFFRHDGGAGRRLVKACRKGAQHENTVNRVIPVLFVNGRHQRRLSRVNRQGDDPGPYPKGGAALDRGAFIERIVFAGAHPQYGKRRTDALGMEDLRFIPGRSA